MKSARCRPGDSGFTITELLISVSLTATLAAVLAVGLVSIQRCFLSSEHHATSRAKQLRIIDYVSRDLRRALTVRPRADGGIDLTIPNFYATSNLDNRKPLSPKIVNGSARYGDVDLQIGYYKRGASVYRTENGTEMLLAGGLDDFILTPEFETAHVAMQISFIPRFRLSGDRSKARDGTLVYAKTLLRNHRF